MMASTKNFEVPGSLCSGKNSFKKASSYHDRFYFQDGNVIFLVEDTLFKVHRYFFQQHSPVFAAMFTLPPPPGELPEGEVESNPIVLEGLKSQDFERFLSILYPQNFQQRDLSTVEGWTSVLTIASMWQFTSLRQLAIDKLLSLTASTPIDRIVLGKRFDVDTWLIPAYVDICVRIEPLNLDEGRRLGLGDVIRIGQVRHQIRYLTNLNRHEDMIVTLVAEMFANREYN